MGNITKDAREGQSEVGMQNDSRTIAQRRRHTGQEALREQLSHQGHLQHAIDMIEKIADVKGEKCIDNKDMDPVTLNRLTIAVDRKLKVVNKYMPDLKATEVTYSADGEQTAEDHAEAIGEIINFPAKRSAASS
jgi:hypothetical protein